MAAKTANRPSKYKGTKDTEDSRLVKALSHPLRARLLSILNERVASPVELSRQLEVPLGNVSYHVRRLANLGCVELVDTRPRRGATEHLYRGTTRSFLNDDNWAQLEESAKQGVTIQGLKMINDANRSAVEAQTFDSRDDRHLSCTPMELDEQGWTEASELLAGALDGLMAVAARSANRRASGESDGALRATASILFYESPPATGEG